MKSTKTFSLFGAVLLLLVSYACYERPEPDLSKIITIQASPIRIPADGTTSTTIVGTIDRGTANDKRVVTLVTTLGKFANGEKAITLTANSTGVISTTLTGDAIGKAIITGTIDQYADTTRSEILISEPAALVVTPDKLVHTNDLGTELKLTVGFQRTTGKPSQGLPLTFKAISENGVEVPAIFWRFVPNTTDAAATVSMVLSDTLFTGVINVEASFMKANNELLKSSSPPILIKSK